MAELAFVGLGANLGEPTAQLASGLAALVAHPGVARVRVSHVYRSAPVGVRDQPDFHNAVAVLHTVLTAAELLALMQRIERDHGRQRLVRWGPRTLDLDLLLHGNQRCGDPALQLPHPRMLERAFVLVPLAEVAPELRHPQTGLPVCGYLASCGRGSGVTRLAPFPG